MQVFYAVIIQIERKDIDSLMVKISSGVYVIMLLGILDNFSDLQLACMMINKRRRWRWDHGNWER